MDLSQDENRLKTIKAKKMMLLFSMLSISMTFAGLTSAYIVSKSRPDWLKEFELPIAFTISTIVILLSSISIWIAKKKC
jgi:cytochrome c oxidase subunit 3